MSIKTKTAPQSATKSAQADDLHGGTDVETGQSTDDHSAVEQLEARPNPLIESVEGGQPRDGRGSVEGDVAVDQGDVERM